MPLYGVRFEIPSGTSMTPCLDARDWCAGEELELGGNRECNLSAITAGPDSCAAWMDCQQAVLVSGVEATMYETVPLQCWRGADGSYECSCRWCRRAVFMWMHRLVRTPAMQPWTSALAASIVTEVPAG